MASWLDKARGKEPTSAETVPFQIECECGSRLSGLRNERAKRVICSQCGAAQFILPINQYPQTERVHFRVSKKLQPESEVSEADRVEIDPIEEDESSYDVPSFGLSEAPDEPDTSSRSSYSDDEFSDDEYDDIESDLQGDSVIAGVDEKGWRAPLRKRSQRKPKPKPGDDETISLPEPKSPQRFLPVLLGFVVIAGGMIFWLMSSQSHEQAEIQLKRAMDEAEAEFFDGNYPQAFTALREADEALKVLGVTDERADRVRNMLKHADASSHLLDGSIMELVDSASQAMSESGDSAWAKQFSINFEGRWFAMQVAVPDSVAPRSRISYDWLVDGQPILMDGLGTIAAWAKTKGELNEMVFAARLKGCRKDPKAGDAWVVEFDPETAFLWTDETSLIRQNMIPVFDDRVATQMRNIVRRQLEIGDAPPPPPPLEEGEQADDTAKQEESSDET
jgi:hypothetical protein